MRRTVLLAAVLLAAGCGGSGGDSGAATVDPGTAIAMNGDTVTVHGLYSRAPGAATGRLCSALDESFPPACSNPALPVSNLSEEREQALNLRRDPETGALWSENEVELKGRIDEGALVVE